MSTEPAVFCITSVLSSASFATSNFASSSGIVVIPDVNVDGKSVYESVTLQLNFSNNTFGVLNAKAKNKTISDTPIDTLTTEGYDIGFLGCATTGTNEITCYMQVVNNQLDRNLEVEGIYNSGSSSLLFDDLNNSYSASSVQFTNATGNGYVTATLIQGLPAKISILFKGINIQAKSISAFKPYFYDVNGRKYFQANFKSIKF